MVRLWSVAGLSLATSHFNLLGSAALITSPCAQDSILVKQTSTLADPKHTRVG